jgi:hypothetical protein
MLRKQTVIYLLPISSSYVLISRKSKADNCDSKLCWLQALGEKIRFRVMLARLTYPKVWCNVAVAK